MAVAVTIDQFLSNARRMVAAAPAEFEKITISLGQSAIPLITNRLINEGRTAEGKSLGTYSDNPISALFFVGKSLGSGAEKRVRDYSKKNKGKISYEKFRELNGRPVTHVTLSFSGETLGDIGVKSTNARDLVVTTSVGSLDRKRKDIVNAKGKKTGEISTGEVLENLNEKYGRALDTELLALSPQEAQVITELYMEKLEGFLKEYLQ
jgi:hypothetical protein